MRVNVFQRHNLTLEDRRVSVVFEQGEWTTKREWGEALVAAGVAEEVVVRKPKEAAACPEPESSTSG